MSINGQSTQGGSLCLCPMSRHKIVSKLQCITLQTPMHHAHIRLGATFSSRKKKKVQLCAKNTIKLNLHDKKLIIKHDLI